MFSNCKEKNINISTEIDLSNKELIKGEDYTIKVENNTASIEIEKLETEVATVRINAEILGSEIASYDIFYTDETSANYRELPSKVLVNNLERSQYTTCYLSGKSDKISINISNNINDNIKLKINSVDINQKVPFNFNIIRFLILLTTIILVYSMIHCKIFNIPYSNENIKQKIILSATVIIFIGITIWIAMTTEKSQSSIYDQFIEALSHGSVKLLQKPSNELINLQNPYDTTVRDGNVKYIWDVAYYNNSYYVYFGILPFLLLSLPVKMLTGYTLNVSIAVLIYSIIVIIMISKILILLYKKWFKNVNFNYLILSIIGTLSGSLIFWVCRRPEVYEFVMTAAVCFSTLGIYMMFKAIENKNKINYKYLCLSTICLASAVACRPNHLLISLIILPVIIQILMKNIKERKDVLKLICTVCIPYLVVGIALMVYNYIRFDNIFEFGASYQLTENDMKDLKNRIFTIPVGLLTQLFKLPFSIVEFPFYVINEETAIPFFGYYYTLVVAGLFILNPINFVLIFLIGLKKKIKDKEAYNCITAMTIVAFLVCILNIVMAGTAQRYSMDYAWLLNIASYLTIFIIVNNIKSKEIKKYILKIVIFVTLFMLFTNFIVGGIVSENNNLVRFHPKTYFSIRYGICFWE